MIAVPTEVIRESVRSRGAGVLGSWELSDVCWELNCSLLEEQPALLTTGPSLQPVSVLQHRYSSSAVLTTLYFSIGSDCDFSLVVIASSECNFPGSQRAQFYGDFHPLSFFSYKEQIGDLSYEWNSVSPQLASCVFSENGVLHLFVAGRRKWIADVHGGSLLKR